MIARPPGTAGWRNPVRWAHGIEVEARRRVQEARPVAQGETSGEAPEAGREQTESQGLGSEIADARTSALARFTAARVARLATTAASGDVRLVPICFARDGDDIVSAVDHKPKTTTALARLADIRRTGRATLLADHYDDADWSLLWWVRITGPAVVHDPADPRASVAVRRLAEKYPQYRQSPPAGPTYSIAIEHLTWWSATS
jgi:PPOX class probable F420-dependent enzyme